MCVETRRAVCMSVGANMGRWFEQGPREPLVVVVCTRGRSITRPGLGETRGRIEAVLAVRSSIRRRLAL